MPKHESLQIIRLKSTFRVLKFSILGLVLSVFAVNFWSCGKANDVPAYLTIEPFTLQVNSAEGTSRHKMSDAWVFLNGENIGIFELPATIPVLDLGVQKVTFFPGIRQNGIKSATFVYPMCVQDTATLNFESGKTVTARPKTKYDRSAQFLYIEDFENAAHSVRFNEDLSNLTNFVSTEGGVEGRSAKLTLSRANNTVAARKASSFRIALPPQYQNLFLEFDHRSDANLGVGLMGYEDGTDKYGTIVKSVLFPRTTWTRTYLNLTNEAKTLKAKEMRVFFTTTLPDSLQTGDVWIDNLKLIVK